jgi:hypothetical protein
MKYCNVERIDSLAPLPESLTVCAMVNDSGEELEITEFMLRRACDEMDTDQIWPFASQALFSGMRSLSTRTADIIQFPRSVN